MGSIWFTRTTYIFRLTARTEPSQGLSELPSPSAGRTPQVFPNGQKYEGQWANGMRPEMFSHGEQLASPNRQESARNGGDVSETYIAFEHVVGNLHVLRGVWNYLSMVMSDPRQSKHANGDPSLSLWIWRSMASRHFLMKFQGDTSSNGDDSPSGFLALFAGPCSTLGCLISSFVGYIMSYLKIWYLYKCQLMVGWLLMATDGWPLKISILAV